jgi:Flp pilus assembly pilin Flp
MYQWVSLIVGRALTSSLSDLKREEGQGVTEYALAVAFVAVALAGILVVLHDQISSFVVKVGTDLAGLPGSL